MYLHSVSDIFFSGYHWHTKQSASVHDFRCGLLRDIAACHKGVAKCHVLRMVDVPFEGGSPSTQELRTLSSIAWQPWLESCGISQAPRRENRTTSRELPEKP
jgi:hypothetical protein